jgi:hypothetical protein
MKRNTIFLLALATLVSCRYAPKNEDQAEEPIRTTTKTYPEHIAKVFKAHGGIDAWNGFESLYFEIEKPEGNEEYQVALKSRKSLNTYKDHLLGYDGSQLWLKDLDTMAFASNPRFVYNLMFYFYAMPFILGDDGINYRSADPLRMDGIEYPGISITYDADIGESPDDEYILYYHPETHKMEWLAYTVTYFSKEKNKDFRYIKYRNWNSVNGLDLPTTLTWYHVENGLPTTARSDRNFVGAGLSMDVPNDDIFAMPEGANTVE